MAIVQICDFYSESNYNGSFTMYSGSSIKIGQSFAGDGNKLDTCKFYLKKNGSPTGNAIATIYAHTGTFGSGGKPTGIALATSDNFDVSILPTLNELITFTFTGINKIILTNETKYFVVLEYSGGDISNNIYFGMDTSSPTHNGNLAKYVSSWNAFSYDAIFYVYTEGIKTQAKINIKATIAQTVQVKARIQKTEIKTIQAKINIKIIQEKTAQIKISIQKTFIQIIQAKCLIAVLVIQNVQIKINIKATVNKSIQTKISIYNTQFRQISTKASVKLFGVFKNISAKTRIEQNRNKTIQAKVNIQTIIVQTIQAKADIKIFNNVQTIQAKTKIEILAVKIIQAKVRIMTTGIAQTIQTKIDIKAIQTKTISAKGRIQITVNNTIQTKIHIKITQLKNISAKIKIFTPLIRREISYKLYQPDGTFLTDITNETISKFSIQKTLNGGVSQLKIALNRPLDNYDEYDAVKNPTGVIKYGNRVKVYLNDKYNTDKVIFYGYLTAIGPEFVNGQEKVILTFYSATSKLSNDYFRTYGDPIDFYVPQNTLSTSTIIKNILDNYRNNVSNPMVSYTWGTSITDTGNSVTYTFDKMKHLASLRKIQEYLPASWYWYCNSEGVMYVRDSDSSTQHTLTLGRHITEIKSHKNINSIINLFVLWNGKSTVDASYVYEKYEDTTSQNDYDVITLFQQDSEVMASEVADIRGNTLIANRKDPKQQLTIEITGNEYNIANIEPGHRINIRNLKDDTQTTFNDNLIVKRVSYSINKILIEVGETGYNLTKFNAEEEDAVQKALDQINKAIEQLQDGNTPITGVNIWNGATQFIEDDVIYSPTIAGVDGYFKESIRLGDSGVGSILRSYGKEAFNNAVAGFWLEKNSLEKVFFELYYNSNYYFRFNTNTGKLEIGADIVMTAGSSITWSNISDAAVPNSAYLSNFNNDNGWTDDTTANAIKNGTVTGTFINGTSIASPTITGGLLQTSASANVGVKISSDELKLYGQTTYFYHTDGTAIGAIWGQVYGAPTYETLYSVHAYGTNAILLLAAYSNVRLKSTNGGIIECCSNVVPDGSLTLGSSVIPWGNAYITNVYLTSTKYLYDSGGILYYNGSPVGVGEVNTASSLGGTYSIYGSKSGVDLRFKGLSVSSRLTITNYGTYLYLDHKTGSGYNHIPSGGSTYQTMRNSASGTGVWASNTYVGGSGSYYFYASSGKIRTSVDFVASGSVHATGNIYTGGILGNIGSVNCGIVGGANGTIAFNLSNRIQVSNHLDPPNAGGYNLGGATRYWNEIHYVSLHSHSLACFDNGVELLDGSIVSDIEAIKKIKPSKKISCYGVPYLDKKTMPKAVYCPALSKKGNDSADITALTSIMLGAIKELAKKIEILQNKINI